MKNVILTTYNDVWRRTSKATVKNARCGFHMLFRMLSAQISNGNIKAKFKWHILYHFFIYFVSYLFDIFKSVAINIYFLNSAIQAVASRSKLGI